MNPHFFQGLIAFVLWSTFSTWYYVKHIKDFPTNEPSIAVPIPATEPDVVSVEVTSPVLSEPEILPEPPLKIQLSHELRFALNTIKPILSSDWKVLLDSASAINEGSKLNITLTGYTCDLGSQEYNMALGQQRAIAVKVLFGDRDAVYKVSSKGQNDPLLPNTSEKNRQQNRRVTILITNQP
ncbi:MAG: outer membrane protein OmpA-like peptidoglycan-associated protein [Cyclobacteriaceae bacterium]|jgi:outer membrane protein OmpA-like peptidoglycan-associated protein